MCGRYCIADGEMELARIVERAGRKETEPVKTGEIFPSDLVPVIANNRRGEKSVFAMRWGYALPRGRVINARSETAVSKPLFEDGMLRRRCLIPASWYFEWDSDKTKYAVCPEGRGFACMAGIYRKEPGTGHASFVILTRAAAPGIAFLHDRMPVILPADMEDAWLDPQSDPGKILAAAENRVTCRATQTDGASR